MCTIEKLPFDCVIDHPTERYRTPDSALQIDVYGDERFADENTDQLDTLVDTQY